MNAGNAQGELARVIAEIDFDSERYYNPYFRPADTSSTGEVSAEVWTNLTALIADLNKLRGEFSRLRRSVEALRLPAIELVGLDELAGQLRGLELKLRPLGEVLSRPPEEGLAKRLMKDLLPVLDALDRVFELAGQQPEALSEGLKRGLGSVYELLRSTLGRHGLERMEVGREFDPYLQMAMGTEPSAELPEGSVSRVLQPGYKLGGQVLRTAQVVVVKNA
jgi:hypothetical protein